MRKAGRVRRGVQRDEEVRRRARMEEKAEGGGERERERALGFREYYLVSVDNDTSASFYSPHQL